MNEKGAPTPVAWTRLRAPESLMGAADTAAMQKTVESSALYPRYATAVDRESAREILAGRLEAGAAKAQAEQPSTQAPGCPAGTVTREQSCVSGERRRGRLHHFPFQLVW